MTIAQLLDIYLDDTNNKKLQRYALKLTGNFHEAEDLISDLLIVIMTKPEVQRAATPMAYFMTSLRNLAYNQRRKNISSISVTLQEFARFERGVDWFQQKLENRQTKSDLRHALEQYSPELVEAFIKYHLEGHSVKELALSLGMRSNTLSKNFSRMRKKLRKTVPYLWGMVMLVLMRRIF